MKKTVFVLIIILSSLSLLAQKNVGTWSRTTKQVQNGKINPDLIGEWKSSVNNPLLSFRLSADRTFSWTFMDTVDIRSNSTFWTKPQMYWTVNGLDLYTLGPKDEKNKWSYAKLGIYYLKKDRLFISECFTNITDLKKHIKSDAWKKDKDTCVHELIKIE